jgi:glutamate--cysteine ligase
MVQEIMHRQIVRNLEAVREWFRQKRTHVDVPIYSSYDIRDSGFKAANVDANIYPAGFNNICRVDRENTGEIMKGYLDRHYEGRVRNVLVITEEHTNNPYYWDNVRALRTILTDGGFNIRLAVPRGQKDSGPLKMKSASGEDVDVDVAILQGDKISVDGFEPDLIVSNNDFSEFYGEWGPSIGSPMNPPRELGWYQRKKSTYFEHYNRLATEFAQVIGVDPWLVTVDTELFPDFDIGDDESRKKLAARVQNMIDRIAEKYKAHGIEQKPFVFVKNNAGTYGLGVIRVTSGEDVMGLNNKTRKKMKAAKGGREIQEVIIQEGIPSIVRSEGVTAEPTLYLIGCQLAGGFLRAHAEKDETESLNSPGAVYKRMCVSDLKVDVEGAPMENVYGWIAKLGVLAIGYEANEMKVEFKGYTRWPLGADPKTACG